METKNVRPTASSPHELLWSPVVTKSVGRRGKREEKNLPATASQPRVLLLSALIDSPAQLQLEKLLLAASY